MVMKNYFENGRHLDVIAETQVLVVGGGPSGIAAAIASARAGAKTMLVESYGCFGGNITHCSVEAVAWYRHSKTIEAGGLLKEMEETAAAMGASTKECQSESQALDAEHFKYVADRMLIKAGVQLLLHCLGVGVIVEEGIIKGIITESKSGRKVIFAQRVIDCTGDADIAALAGAPFIKAPKEKLMSVTPVFQVCNVDTTRFINYILNDLKPTYRDWGGTWGQEIDEKDINRFTPYIESCFLQAKKDGVLPTSEQVGFGGTYSTVTSDGSVTQMNLIFMHNIDCTDVFDLTKAEIEGREYVLMAIEALRRYLPGFEKAKLRNFTMKLGTRESRKILGNYFLTEDDVKNQCRFSDSIGIYPEFIDGLGTLRLPTTGRYMQIPYGVILPQKVDNLLVAGRSISGDEIAHAGCRNMSCCVVTGQGAGVAAAVSLQEEKTTQNVSISAVQAELVRQNVKVF